MGTFKPINSIMICSGENCPIRMTCLKHHKYMISDKPEDEETMTSDFHNGECMHYEQREFYGQ